MLLSRASLEKQYCFSCHILFRFLLPQTEGAASLYILIYQCFVCSLIFYLIWYIRLSDLSLSLYIFFLFLNFMGFGHVEFTHNLVPNSLDINFNTTHSSQCHSQVTSSPHVLRGFCEYVILITHSTALTNLSYILLS